MKIVIIGGTGLIGSKLAAILRGRGHEVVAAAPSTGVDTLTGAGLAAALEGADTVVDVANSPSFEDRAVLEFFETSGRNLLRAERDAGVRHHVALSVVGTERLQASGYFRAKAAQERLIEASRIPYTVVHSTQFFEFMRGIAAAAPLGEALRLPAASMQPIASDDVATAMADATRAPINGKIEIGGPERVHMVDIVGRYLQAVGDTRTVVADAQALYFGAPLADDTLLPGDGARLGAIRFETWLAMQRPGP
jgi:uncharacterized protein YbjT (DUF2867 family)